MIKTSALLLAVLAALTGDLPFEAPPPEGGASDADAEPHTRARLVASVDAVAPGRSFDVAIVLESDPGWHTYWKNPGDAGMATTVEWKLPKGWTAGELQWPAPARFQEKEVTTFGYAGEPVWLLASVQAPAKASGKSVTLSARVDWLECREICLPGSADVALTLPAGKAAPVEAAAFEAARARVPHEPKGWTLRASWPAKDRLTLSFVPPAGTSLEGDAAFFAETPGVIDPTGSARAKLTANAKGGYSLELARARLASGPTPPMMEGVLVSGGKAWRVRVPL